jgi:hypothetical protein
MKIGLPRQAGIGPSISPTCKRLISIRTGAPAALAFALGLQEPIKGTAAPTTPAAPTAEVDVTKNLLRPAFALSSVTVFLLQYILVAMCIAMMLQKRLLALWRGSIPQIIGLDLKFIAGQQNRLNIS